jgi:hypothetical protein
MHRIGVPTTEVGYNFATAERADHEVHKDHVVALGKKNFSEYLNGQFIICGQP